MEVTHDASTGCPGTVVFDLDGVVYLGSTPIRGAAGTIAMLQGLGWQILYATNNSTKSSESVAALLADRVGVSADPSSVLTSAMAVSAHLSDTGLHTAFIVGSQQLEDTVRLGGVSIVDHLSAEVVVVGLDRSLTKDTIARAAGAIERGAAFVATNTDATFPTPDGHVPGAGATVQAIVDASGGEVVVCGKPHEPMVELVSRQIHSKNVWMVGDRPETDVAFARRAGWRSVLTLSGITTTPEEIPEELMPDDIIESIAGLVGIVT